MLLKVVLVVVLAGGVLGGAVLGTRWVLAWDDLPSYAKPDGFREVAHRVGCSNLGNQYCVAALGGCHSGCWHDWLYVSDERRWEDAAVELVSRYQAAGWRVHGCGPPNAPPVPELGCFVAIKGEYEECFVYHDYKRRSYRSLEEWRQKHIARIEPAEGAVLVTTGCA